MSEKERCKKPSLSEIGIIILFSVFFTLISSFFVLRFLGAISMVKLTGFMFYCIIVGVTIGFLVSLFLHFYCSSKEEIIHGKKPKTPSWCDQYSWLWLWAPLAIGAVFGPSIGYYKGLSQNKGGYYAIIGFMVGISIPLITSAIIIGTTCRN